jgi:hypothetical protein
MLRKFVVLVAGDGCRVRITGTLGPSRMTQGFYATRFVIARDAEEAGLKALALIASDLSDYSVDVAGVPPHLSVDEVREDALAYDAFAPNHGFTWF